MFLLGQIRICRGFYTVLVRKETSESPPRPPELVSELGGNWEGAGKELQPPAGVDRVEQ